MVTKDNSILTSKKEKCQQCKDISKPDIMTAYQHVGESLSELYHCCANKDENSQLPKDSQSDQKK